MCKKSKMRYGGPDIRCGGLIFLAGFVLVLALTLTSTARADLIGCWRFDEGSGATINDSSGNGNDMQTSGCQ